MSHKKPAPQVVPSLLSADFTRLKAQIRAVEKAGARRLHLDVMDGHFVPNITIGPFIIAAIRKATGLHLETHLMIENANKYIERFIQAGSDTVIVHVEASRNPHADFDLIRKLGAKVGIVLNPPTKFEMVEPYLAEIDHLLVMTVNPGFGAQKIIAGALDKVHRAQVWQERYGFLIEVDGGINRQTIGMAALAGADLLVAGHAVYGRGRPGQAFKTLSQLIQ